MRKRKITAIILTLVLVFATATSAFANEDNYMLIKKTDPTEKYLKGAIENLDVVAAKKTIANEIIAQKDDITVKFPTKENKNINIECDGENVVSMEIPKDNESPYIARNGSIAYNGYNGSSKLITQTTSGYTTTGLHEIGVRTLILINNSDAPHEYEFKFTLADDERFECKQQNHDGKIYNAEIYIINSDGFITGSIKEPWAKDADGNSIETFFTIKGDTITQHVAFSTDTAFPVVADPWYGQSSKTENIGSPKETTFSAYAAGQGTKGFKFTSAGGYISYTRGSGTTASTSVSLGVGYGSVTLSVNIGTATQGSIVGAAYPVSGAGWYKLRVNEVYMVQKYKVLMRWKDSATGDITWREISRNAKTTEFVGVSGQCVKTAEV
jgi:hypothetical protein